MEYFIAIGREHKFTSGMLRKCKDMLGRGVNVC
jgi:hypothetical protein